MMKKLSRARTVLLFSILLPVTSLGLSAHPATGIVVDRQGRIYFSDLENVWRIDASGTLSKYRPGVGGRHVHELALDADGNLYGANLSYFPATGKWVNEVWKMTPDGKSTFLVDQATGLPQTAGIWRDAQGAVYFIEQNNHTKRETLILKQLPDGKIVTVAGGAYGHADGKGSQARFSNIAGFTLGPDGSIYVADGASVRRVLMDGTVTTLARNLDAFMAGDRKDEQNNYGGLMGLAVDAQGQVYAADYRNRRVLKVTPKGEVSVVARSESPWSPTGVAVGEQGSVLLLEIVPPVTGQPAIGPRVRKISADGNLTVLATVGEAPPIPQPKVLPAENGAKIAPSNRVSLTLAVAVGLGLAALFLKGWRRKFLR